MVKRFGQAVQHTRCTFTSAPSPRPAGKHARLVACAAITVLNYIGTCGTDPVNFVCNRVAELAHRRLIAFPIKHIAI